MNCAVSVCVSVCVFVCVAVCMVVCVAFCCDAGRGGVCVSVAKESRMGWGKEEGGGEGWMSSGM